jgi:LPXTG-motif cell wall-anchored protein
MAGGKLEGASAHDAPAPRQLTRRDFTRFGAVAGGIAWTAPKVTSIRFADKLVGSHVPRTTTTPEPTNPTTSTTRGPNTTTTTRPATTTTTVPEGPLGSTTVPGSTTTTRPGTTPTSDVGPLGPTSPSTTVPETTTSIETTPTSVGPGNNGNNPPGGGLGGLSFTGADTIDLAILGATALVTGRALYAFGRRRREEEELPVDGLEGGPAVD